MIQVIPIPAFQDNYIWLLHQHGHAVVIDPGEAEPVLNAIRQHQLTLDAILITHHHADHIGGVEQLLTTLNLSVYAPAIGRYSFPHEPVTEGDHIALPALSCEFQVISVPGHTLDHIAYYGANCLFCGDALFGAGCGRLFEGTPEQAYQSLQKLTKLPSETKVYCAHEYTQLNIAFARGLDPSNDALKNRETHTNTLRAAQLPSLPSTIAMELATNPFLRCHLPEIQASSGCLTDLGTPNPVAVFAKIRSLRNQF